MKKNLPNCSQLSKANTQYSKCANDTTMNMITQKDLIHSFHHQNISSIIINACANGTSGILFDRYPIYLPSGSKLRGKHEPQNAQKAYRHHMYSRRRQIHSRRHYLSQTYRYRSQKQTQSQIAFNPANPRCARFDSFFLVVHRNHFDCAVSAHPQASAHRMDIRSQSHPHHTPLIHLPAVLPDHSVHR